VDSIDRLVSPLRDPLSEQPESKYIPIRVQPYQAAWYGFLLSRRRLDLNNAAYWSCTKGNGMRRYEIAGEQAPRDRAGCARQLLCSEEQQVDWMEFFDSSANRYRAARLVDGMLESCIFIGPDVQLPSRGWLATRFEEPSLDELARSSLLTGKPGQGQNDAGRTVCACFSVGLSTIVDALQHQGLATAEEIGAALKAGTICGSCVPELKALLQAQGMPGTD